MESNTTRPCALRSGQRFQINPDVVAKRLGDETVLVHLQTNHMYALNRTATRLWELLAAGCDRAQIQQQLLQEFDVDEAHLAGEIETLFASLIDAHLLSAYASE